MKPPISAAELIALRSPGKEDVKAALPIILKEMALSGWVSVFRKKPQLPMVLWALLITSILMTTVALPVGVIGAVGSLFMMWCATRVKTFIALTPSGETILRQKIGPDAPLLVRAVQTVWAATPDNEDSCTAQKWREHLRAHYADNQGFHQRFLLHSLRKKGWLAGPDNAPVRTKEGDAVLEQSERLLTEHHDLPQKVRLRSPEAARAALSLGGLVLLLPGMEGLFNDLRNVILENPYDLREKTQPATSSDSSGSNAGVDGIDEKHPEEMSDDGLDWGDNSDFLDGDFDSDIDGNDSDCGVEGGGDGDGGGCDSGCGGD